jgi:hypothetical protein
MHRQYNSTHNSMQAVQQGTCPGIATGDTQQCTGSTTGDTAICRQSSRRHNSVHAVLQGNTHIYNSCAGTPAPGSNIVPVLQVQV